MAILRRLAELTRALVRFGPLVLVALFLITGCNRPWRDAYFDKGLQKLNQADVQERLGPPHTNKTSLLGEQSVWTYRYPVTDEEMDPWGSFGKTASRAKEGAAAIVGQGKDQGKYPTLRCVKYTLKFDEEKILQDWKRDACQPTNQAAAP